MPAVAGVNYNPSNFQSEPSASAWTDRRASAAGALAGLTKSGFRLAAVSPTDLDLGLFRFGRDCAPSADAAFPAGEPLAAPALFVPELIRVVDDAFEFAAGCS